MPYYANALADYATRTSFATLPANVVHHAKFVLMDAIGVGLAGAPLNKDWCNAAIHLVRAQGGMPQATVWFHGDRTSSANAAFANGMLVHSMDFSDDLAGIQIGGIVPTTAMAVGESVGASGEEVLSAMVLGYDIAGRFAQGMDSQGLYIRGLQPTAMVGGFAAAAVAGRLLGLNATQMANAFGIVASYAAGTIEFLKHGTDTKRLHPAKTAHSGTIAAYLAQGGLSGPHSILEGDFGVFNAYSDNPNLSKLTEDLGSRFDVLGTSIKIYPFCDGNIGPLEAVRNIIAENRLDLSDIDKMHFRMVTSLIHYVINLNGDTSRKYRPVTDLDAQMSLPYCIAVGLLRDGDVWLEDFDPSRYDDSEIHALADKVTAVADTSLDGGPRLPITMPTIATLTTTDGRTFEKRVDYQRGDPRNPMSEAELSTKFDRCCAGIFGVGAAARIRKAILDMDSLGDIGQLADMLVAPSHQSGLGNVVHAQAPKSAAGIS